MALTYGIPYAILNAKYHEKEAQIIAEAGRAGAVTIATNMAGRGVDIILGGTPDPNADGSGRLRLEDIRDMTALAKKLHAARDPLTRYLQGRLSAETRQLMEIDLYEGAMAPSEKLEAALVDELNRVILGPCIYDSQRFQHLMLSDEARDMVVHDGSLPAEQTPLLNRRLLESAFPREIARAYRLRRPLSSARWAVCISSAPSAMKRGALIISSAVVPVAKGPGSSRFYLSLEDELWRLFGDRGHALLGSWPEEEPVEAKLLTKAIERAQKKVEERNLGIREHTLKSDDVDERAAPRHLRAAQAHPARRPRVERRSLPAGRFARQHHGVGARADRGCGQHAVPIGGGPERVGYPWALPVAPRYLRGVPVPA